jgi:hypothetical protein
VDNLRVINPNDQRTLALRDAVRSSALQSKALRDGSYTGVPTHRVHPRAVTNKISPPRPRLLIAMLRLYWLPPVVLWAWPGLRDRQAP